MLITQGEADAYHASSSSGRTALLEAAAIGSCPCIQALVEEGGSDVNMVNELRDGEHPLLVAAAAGGWRLVAREWSPLGHNLTPCLSTRQGISEL